METRTRTNSTTRPGSVYRRAQRFAYKIARRLRLAWLVIGTSDVKLRRGLRAMQAPWGENGVKKSVIRNSSDEEVYQFALQLLDKAGASLPVERRDKAAQDVDITDTEQIREVVSRIFSERRSQETACNEPAQPVSISPELVGFGDQITERASASLRGAREQSEDAVLRIGAEISEFYKIAKTANEAVNNSLNIAVDGGAETSESTPASQLCVTEMIRKQQTNMSGFLSKIISYFERQTELAGKSKARFADVQNCVKQVERIVRSAQVLAVNVQVESARLGEKGRAFSILGSKMKTFSEQVESANESIQSAVGDVVGVMRDFESEALEIDSQLHGYVAQFSQDLAQVESRANELKTSMVDTLEMVNSSNQGLIERSQNALSALQFQDPLVKSLLLIEQDLHQLNEIVKTGGCESSDLMDDNQENGELAAVGPECGEVELF